MIYTTCIRRFKNKSGVIVGYELLDTKGNTLKYKSVDLKKDIMYNRVAVNNLILTFDGKLRVKSINLRKVKRRKISSFFDSFMFNLFVYTFKA